jgi:hypothetical protein
MTSGCSTVYLLAMTGHTCDPTIRAGECEYPEFVEIMTSTLAKLSHKREEQAGGNQVRPLPPIQHS